MRHRIIFQYMAAQIVRHIDRRIFAHGLDRFFQNRDSAFFGTSRILRLAFFLLGAKFFEQDRFSGAALQAVREVQPLHRVFGVNDRAVVFSGDFRFSEAAGQGGASD